MNIIFSSSVAFFCPSLFKTFLLLSNRNVLTSFWGGSFYTAVQGIFEVIIFFTLPLLKVPPWSFSASLSGSADLTVAHKVEKANFAWAFQNEESVSEVVNLKTRKYKGMLGFHYISSHRLFMGVDCSGVIHGRKQFWGCLLFIEIYIVIRTWGKHSHASFGAILLNNISGKRIFFCSELICISVDSYTAQEDVCNGHSLEKFLQRVKQHFSWLKQRLYLKPLHKSWIIVFIAKCFVSCWKHIQTHMS